MQYVQGPYKQFKTVLRREHDLVLKKNVYAETTQISKKFISCLRRKKVWAQSPNLQTFKGPMNRF